ncbi:MAG: Ppx/GppA family phosphatase [Demequinaceae bacterium]|nr:Ppx/GppA family phosphatase [Demequinaceae bacterium]
MPRVAAIDCGTNSLRLLIADVDVGRGELTEVHSDMVIVRLGQGVDRTGRFADEALVRAFDVIDLYGEQCRAAGVELIRFVATSATRDASNRDEFVAGVESRLGIQPDVISGVEEARLSFRGATQALDETHPGPYLVADLGGGSTELVLGMDNPEAEYSMDVGCVRMFERHDFSDPPTDAEIEAAVADIDAALDRAAEAVPLGRTRTLVGLAGTVTTIAAHALNLATYDRERIHGSVFLIEEACEAASSLTRMTHDERAALGFMDPGRVDVIGAGALVWRQVMLRVEMETMLAGARLDTVVTSEHDILDGIAWETASGASPAGG